MHDKITLFNWNLEGLSGKLFNYKDYYDSGLG
jgi:hypothetical protein